MISEKIKVRGTPTFSLYGEDGKLKHQFTLPNRIVQGGTSWMANRLTSNTSNVMSHIAIGSGITSTAATNTTLETELARGAMSVSGGVVTGNIIKFTATLGAGVGTGTIGEAGVFNAASSGTMLSRVVFTPFVKASPDTLIIEWEIEIAQ